MGDKIRIINKITGQTPLECINELKKSEPELAYLPLTYAGRLDPLAEGVLVILIGEECLKKNEYLKLSKEYEVEVLFGFATDTYDVMGKVRTTPETLFERSSDLRVPLGQTISNSISGSIFRHLSFDEALKNILSKFTGLIKQFYPPYSSRPVDGKPLFQWAREGKLSEIIIPAHDVLVEDIKIIDQGFISGEKLLNKIKKNILQVNGDFRQKEIIDIWQDTLKNKKEEKFKIIKLKIICGSGVYVRGIAHDIGLALGVPALAFKIVRTRVGKYSI